MTFKERLEYGEKAVEKTTDSFLENNIEYEYIVNPEKWKNTFGKELIYLKIYDLENGDVLLLKKLKCDIKRDKITLKSILNFKGDYFILWRASLLECIVIEPKEILNKINIKNCTHVDSTDEGFTFEQLQKLNHMTLDQFIEYLKTI